MTLLISFIAICFAPSSSSLHVAENGSGVLSSDELKPLTWRSVGPANMGGRVADIRLASSDGKSFFVAFGTGGLWKTTNRGTTFKPVFDKEATASIGSVDIADAPVGWKGWKDVAPLEKDPNKLAEMGKGRIVWVGTGEGNGRNSSSWGNGVYRSTDGGQTWTHLGLEDTKDIPKIAADPRDPDTCYVAAMGHLWGRNKERGVFKTTDGGKSWKPVLQISDVTGAIDLVIDPKNPDTVFAAMYQRSRTAYSFESGGPDGGIYRSRDAGKSWQKLTKGLPSQTGRIGLDVCLKNPKVVYAVVESDDAGPTNLDDGRSRRGGVFRSDDGGDTWTRVNAQDPRAFYFSKIRVDPTNENRVYLVAYDMYRSDDGGKTFTFGFASSMHGDWHALIIDPLDPDHLLAGSDGGAFQSFDRGATWDFMNTMAVGEFYNIALDDGDPYRILGGLQDNGSWIGVSSTNIETGVGFAGSTNYGITNAEWKSIGDSDGFHVAFDPTDPNIVYSESQGGGLLRYNMLSGEYRGLQPSQKEGRHSLRFNWNSPFFVSSHDPTKLYLGGNYVFELTERGNSWRQISPDLSTRDPEKMDTVGSSAETHCTVVALAESSVEKGALWAGSDDGLIHVTTNDGLEWRDVTPKAVHGWYVANIEASHTRKETAYAAIDGHRSDYYDPLILVTDDLGRSWRDITGDLPKGQSVRVVREDLKNPEVLYCGTEIGVYVSADRGSHWCKLGGPSLPTVSVHDIVQHPRTMDLVIATHGRSVWVMDDASPLSQVTSKVEAEGLHVFEPQPAKPVQRGPYDGLWGHKFFGATNAATGARISYWCKERHDDGPSIKIENEKAEAIATLSGPASAGLNRVIWDMQPELTRRIANRGEAGTLYVPAGKYKVTVTLGKNVQSVWLTVMPYPYNSDSYLKG